MVSVQEAQRQREKQLRAERLKQARQVGAELGKMGARRYQEAKKEQHSKVTAQLREQWESEQSSRLQQSKSMSFEIERRRGEGMRNAEAFVGQQFEAASEEKAAWKAERSLEKQRMQVGLHADRLKKEEERLKLEEVQARREYVREVESARSKRAVVLATRTNEANARLKKAMADGAVSSADSSPASFLSPGRGGGNPVTLHTKDDAKESAEREAAKLAEQRQRELQRKQTDLEKRQEAAKQRAIKAMEEDRLAQEKIRIEKEQELAFKAKMMEENFRRGPNSVTVDYQEQEARKATAMNRKAHVEFEETFLRGPWKDAMASHRPPAEDTTSSSSLSRLSWSAAEMQQHQGSGDDDENSAAAPAPPSWLTTILAASSNNTGMVSTTGGNINATSTNTTTGGGEATTRLVEQQSSSANGGGSSSPVAGLRLKAVPLQVTSLVVADDNKEEGEAGGRDGGDNGSSPQAEENEQGTEEEARGTSPEPHDFIPIPQPKLSQNSELMQQVEDILAAAGVDAAEFPGVVAAASAGKAKMQQVGQEEEGKETHVKRSSTTTTSAYATTTTGYYGSSNDEGEEHGEDDDEDDEDTEDEFERVASQQRMDLRQQHERYLNDLNQLRERIANSAAGNLKPAASYVDPTLLLPPLSSSHQSNTHHRQQQFLQETVVPVMSSASSNPTAASVQINPRYQLVAMSDKAKILEQQRKEHITTANRPGGGGAEILNDDAVDAEMHPTEEGQERVAAAAVDTTLSPMSTPDKTTNSNRNKARNVNLVSSSSEEEE